MCREIGQEPVVLVNRAEYRDDVLKAYCRKAELTVIGEIPDDREIAEVLFFRRFWWWRNSPSIAYSLRRS